MVGWVMWLLVVWSFIMVILMAIGGFFMFRKFLKSLPKEDGKSELDWQNYYINKTLHLWNDEAKQLLNELVSPVPELFRQQAKESIAGKISELAVKEKAKSITEELIIRGYIVATPKRDHKFLRKKLAEMNIDVTPYEKYFAESQK